MGPKNGKINMLWLNDAETSNCHRDERLNLRLTVTKSILYVRGMTGLMYGNMYFKSTVFFKYHKTIIIIIIISFLLFLFLNHHHNIELLLLLTKMFYLQK